MRLNLYVNMNSTNDDATIYISERKEDTDDDVAVESPWLLSTEFSDGWCADNFVR